MTGKIIVVEGYDGTGKTTLAKSLAIKMKNGIYFPNPKGRSSFTKDMYVLMKKHIDINEDAKILMFLANHIININDMNKLKDQGKTVICDRSILSTLAYQFITVHRLRELLHSTKVPDLNYDKAIVLTANMNTVMTRIGHRGPDDLDQYFISNLFSIKDCYDTLRHDIYPIDKCLTIDTSNKTIDVVLDIATIFMGK